MIEIVSYNIKNFKNNHILVKDIISKHKIVYLIEHWLAKEEEHIIKDTSKDHKVLFYSEFSELENRRGRPFGGTSWVIHNDYEIVNHINYDRHLSTVEIKPKNLNRESILLIGVWMPFDDGTAETWAKIQVQFSSIQGIIDSLDVQQKWIMMGDWNMDIKRTKRADERFKEFLTENYLDICENRFSQDVDFSYFNGDYRSHIDHIICNEEVVKYTRACKILDYRENLSDHLPLIISISDEMLVSTNVGELYNKKFYRFPWENENFQLSYKKNLDRNIREVWSNNYNETITSEIINNCISEMHKSMIRSAREAEKELGLNKKKIYSIREIRMDSQLQDAMIEVNYWHSIWREYGDEEARGNWKESKKIFGKLQRAKVDETKRAHCCKIEDLYKYDRNKFWNYVRRNRAVENKIDLKSIDFISYYSKLYSSERDENNQFHKEVEEVVLDKARTLENELYLSTISVNEVKEAIQSLSIGKSVGYDNIPAEMYVYGKETSLVVLLAWVIAKMFALGYMPKDFNIALITPIAKTTKPTSDPGDFRPISVSTTLSLIFENIIRDKICLSIHSNQFGFKPRTSTKMAYFVLNETLHYYSSNKSKCWVASLDATKAFDKMWRCGLFYKLIGKVPDVVWRILYKYYGSSEAAVRIGGSVSDKFRVLEGVKQGGVISPFLFNFFIDDLIQDCVKLDVGAFIGATNVSILGYCDDLVLISPLKGHLNILIKKCEEFAHKWKLKFNPKKSVVYCTDKDSLNQHNKFYITGEEMKHVESFEYLGLPIGDSKYIDSFIEQNFRAVEKAFFMIRNIGLHKNIIEPTCLGFIYKQYCQSIINYGLEVVSISKTVLKQLDIRQGILIKMSLGLSKFSRTRPLLDALNINPVSELYYKFKYLFRKQINNNYLVLGVYNELNEYYGRSRIPKYSFIRQLKELDKVVENFSNLDKKEFLQKLREKFRSDNLGLVDSIRYVINEYNNNEMARSLLRSLLWVDFYT